MTEVVDGSNHGFEQQSFLDHDQRIPARWEGKPAQVPIFNKIMGIVNVLLFLILALSIALVAHSTTKACPQSVARIPDIYSPAASAVVPIIKRFKPEHIFQSETSDEVEAAWKRIQGASEGVVALGPEESAKLAGVSHESTVSIYEPEKQIYGLEMYHQLHCLDIVRKSFYRNKFFPGVTDSMFIFHKNHCIDYLRQTIMCHGDTTMTYWWNKNYTTTLSDGTEVYSEWYKNADTKARSKGSFVNWDIEHSCRDTEPLEEWVKAHPPVPAGVTPVMNHNEHHHQG